MYSCIVNPPSHKTTDSVIHQSDPKRGVIFIVNSCDASQVWSLQTHKVHCTMYSTCAPNNTTQQSTNSSILEVFFLSEFHVDDDDDKFC